ncbi:MAG TPA: MerR family transcriptional regulator, partial [Acidimicrobiia bacterium]
MVSFRSEPVYSIGAVARMTGSTPAALRAWEDRYGVVLPSRSPAGQRQYSRDQIDHLRYVHGLVEGGLQAAEAHRLLAQRLRDSLPVAPPAPVPAPDREPVSILVVERDGFAEALLEDLLQTQGYAVALLSHDGDAVAVYGEQRPDLMFLELVISGRSGLELCRTLEAAGARVVAVSALALGDAAVEAGAEAFL